MTLTLIDEAPSRRNRRYGLYRCACGKEKEILAIDVDRGRTTSCGCRRGLRPQEEPRLVHVALLIPAPWRRSDLGVLGALTLAGVDPWELATLQPSDAAEWCARHGVEVDEINRPFFSRWLRADAFDRLYGREIAAGELFGPALERWKERVAA